MALLRTIVILLGALTVMLGVVILRAETARIHYEVSRLDEKAEVLWQQVREEELELARLRNPALIRARAAEIRLTAEPAAPKPPVKNTPAARPSAGRKSKP